VQHLKNIGVKESNGIIYYINKDISVLMSYIITQSDHSIIEDLKEIDVMVEELTEKTKVFSSHEEAEIYLINDGIYPQGGVFPFNIRIQRVQ
tara:strand:+ start:672 stop:947 length:276 start_codon:yes stop_codon:yes gene_type:complete